ncbi:L-2-hydroxyglutarate oxidase [Neorhodopirellula pilleata]|nr:L-2-hydroxyglutarate oxidase [Neorhodopirellula pilleata]
MISSSQTFQSRRGVIGGGIVGLATALHWMQSEPSIPVDVIEAEPEIARHQSGHNSGVLHSGIYYRPRSEKAILCREGKAKMESFCSENGIRWERCGKVIVATDQNELASLETIAERGRENEVEFERIHTDRLRQLEPSVAGIAAIHVADTGIVDYRQVCAVLRNRIVSGGGRLLLNRRVTRIDCHDRNVRLGFADGADWHGDEVIACGGLHSDRLYQLALRNSAPGQDARLDHDIRIVPFRGEYYQLIADRRHLCRNLIYPVPDPRYPFLGVHFTRMIGEATGDAISETVDPVECGPNAVLAMSRHGYTWSQINGRDLMDTLGFTGFRRLASQHWRMGMGEIHRSLRKSVFVRSLQRLIPAIRSEDLIPARAGVRAQAVRADGTMVDDFLFRRTPRMTHVLNAPSPAATASFAIARRILEVHRSVGSESSS